ncbi:MAG: hypothetical protein ACRC6B_06770 [Fusobacteriaceae bacterium]
MKKKLTVIGAILVISMGIFMGNRRLNSYFINEFVVSYRVLMHIVSVNNEKIESIILNEKSETEENREKLLNIMSFYNETEVARDYYSKKVEGIKTIQDYMEVQKVLSSTSGSYQNYKKLKWMSRMLIDLHNILKKN